MKQQSMPYAPSVPVGTGVRAALKSVLVGAAVMLAGVLPARAGSVAFSYTLPAAATTSAGAYKTDGTLVRTLWSNQPRPAGTMATSWDGLDDNGRPVTAGSYQIKILTHNVTYTWQGYIGNTSTSQTGPTTHRSLSAIQGLAITGTSIFPYYGYNERRPLWSRLTTADPNSVAYWGTADLGCSFTGAATDGTNVYYMNEGNGSTSTWRSFVAAFKVIDNTAVTFANGVPAPAGGSGSAAWDNVIDLNSGQSNAPTGIAVQPAGSYLFVAHGGANQVKVLNKTTGALVNTVTVTAPGELAATQNGDVWVICTEGTARVLRRYNVDSAGNFTAGAVKTGLNNPLSLAVSPDNNTLLVADGGTIQQVKAYTNISTGTVGNNLWAFGTQGGYNAANGPDVTNTKFCFLYDWAGSSPYEGSSLAFQSDGSFWLGDPGNERTLHFSASRAYLGQIAYPTRNYVTTVCNAAPTRVFVKGWLEYAVDYSQPPSSGWSLVKNWTAGLPASLAHVNMGGLNAVVKLSNGRTYGAALNTATSKRAIVELPATGPARITGIEFPSTQTFHEDGSLRWQTLAANAATYSIQTLSGFDASGNPLFAAATTLGAAPRLAMDPVSGNGWVGPSGPRFPTTSGNVMVVSNAGSGWVNHLGGITPGGTNWLWKAAPPAVYFDGHGSVGAFCQYPASNTQTVQGHNILFGCHGEFYTPPGLPTGQANQFLHYWDNGLMVGEFGGLGSGNPLNSVVAGVAGNAFSPYMVSVGSNLYVWHNDEWGTGVHRWLINNAGSVSELAPINVTLPATGGNGTGLTGQYFSGTNLDTILLTRTDQTVNFSWPAAPDSSVPADNFSVRWTGLVQPLYSQSYTFYTQSDNGVRLWVNGTKVIDNWTSHGSTENASAPISLTAGQKYTVRMEFYEATGSATAQLKWSSTSQAKGIIPMQQLYPSGAQAINCGGPTVGRFQQDPLGITGTAILTTANTIDLSGVDDPGPMAIYQVQRRFNSSYDFNNLTPFANHRVRLHLAEIVPGSFSVGARVFPVTVNRIDKISPDVDPYALAGAGYKAVVREFIATADNTGTLHLTFSSSYFSLLAGIEVGLDTSDAATNPAFALSGVGTGLKGQYYSGTAFNTLVLTRTDPEVNFSWGNVGPNPSVGAHNYTVRWTGKVQSVEPGSYNFAVNATNGARLWVNNQLLIDSWTASGNHTAAITLAASTKYDIKLEYIDNASSAAVALNWQRPGTSVARILPQSQLDPAP